MIDIELTPDEIMVVCMARQIHDSEVVTQGLATPLVTTAYLLAKQTHAPNIYFTSAIGQGICRTPAPMNLSNIESLWLDRSLTNVGFALAMMSPARDPAATTAPTDLRTWREVGPVMHGRLRRWDELIGSGPPPVKTSEGWLHVYHGVATHFSAANVYQAGVALLDLDDPLGSTVSLSSFDGDSFILSISTW